MSIVIWMQVQADPFLQQRAARSRSRFDFAQDDSQPSSAVAHGNGVGGAGLSFADWAHPPGGGLSIWCSECAAPCGFFMHMWRTWQCKQNLCCSTAAAMWTRYSIALRKVKCITVVAKQLSCRLGLSRAGAAVAAARQGSGRAAAIWDVWWQPAGQRWTIHQLPSRAARRAARRAVWAGRWAAPASSTACRLWRLCAAACSHAAAPADERTGHPVA